MDQALELKKTLADAIRKKMKTDGLTISAFAIRTRTGRNAIKRLLDPRNTSVTFKTIAKSADSPGLKLSLVAEPMSSVKIARLAQAMVDAPTEKAANALKEQILDGFYGLPPVHAKASKAQHTPRRTRAFA